MNIVDVLGLKWLNPDHTKLGGQVITTNYGAVPICIHEGYDTETGQKLWADALAGKHGLIFDYTRPPDPTPEEKRAQMPALERWRVNTIIDLEPGLREKINAAIDEMTEPKRTISKNKLADVQLFSRLDPLFEIIGSTPSIGKTHADIDLMWEAAAALE